MVGFSLSSMLAHDVQEKNLRNPGLIKPNRLILKLNISKFRRWCNLAYNRPCLLTIPILKGTYNDKR